MGLLLHEKNTTAPVQNLDKPAIALYGALQQLYNIYTGGAQ
jgi:hypothetical protein